MNYDVILNANDSETLETQYAFTQGDYGQIQFSVRVKADGEYITNASRAYIVFNLSNGMIVTGADMPKSGATYTYVFQGNELQSSGEVLADVKLVYANGQMSSNKFSFICRNDPLNGKKVPAGPYITELQQIVNDGQQKIDYLQSLIDALQGDLGGTPLTRSDLVNNFLATVPGEKPLDAVAGRTLYNLYEQVNSNLKTQVLPEDPDIDAIKDDGYYTFRITTGIFSGWNIMRVRSFHNNPDYAEQILTRLYDNRVYKRQKNGGTWGDWSSTALNSDLADAAYMDISFYTGSHVYVEKHFGIVSFTLFLTLADVPSVPTFSNVVLPITIPEAYRPIAQRDFARLVADSPDQEGAYLTIGIDGTIALSSRYKALAPNVGWMHAQFEYRGK